MKLTAHITIDMNTSHLSEATRDWLELACQEGSLRISNHPGGYFLSTDHRSNIDIPMDLRLCLNVAASQNAQYLLIDDTAPVLDGLPRYAGNKIQNHDAFSKVEITAVINPDGSYMDRIESINMAARLLEDMWEKPKAHRDMPEGYFRMKAGERYIFNIGAQDIELVTDADRVLVYLYRSGSRIPVSGTVIERDPRNTKEQTHGLLSLDSSRSSRNRRAG